jgi:hypothetical protein
MSYVILNIETRKYVAPPGQKHSYTKFLQDARKFESADEARRDCCGNERVIPLESADTVSLALSPDFTLADED